MNQSAVKSISEPRLFGKDLGAIESWVVAKGEPAFRAKQIYEWLYAKGVRSFSEMSNLSEKLRANLESEWILGRTEADSVSESADGTKKYLFAAGNKKYIESAYIPEPDRATLCVSTQAGCKMGCIFCATARQGFQGNLDAGQIVNQLYSLPERERISNIVYMGMGEPLDNQDGTFGSLRILMNPRGANMAARRITLSTIGLPGPLEAYLKEFDSHLAISIHSPFDDERKSLMPIQHVFPIKDTLGLLKGYSFSDHHRLSFEYIMFDKVNDSPSHARELARILSGLPCRINLIHYHSVPGNDLQGSPRADMEAFQTILKDKGYNTTIRRSRGEDIQAACGLLSTKALLRNTDQDTRDW